MNQRIVVICLKEARCGRRKPRASNLNNHKQRAQYTFGINTSMSQRKTKRQRTELPAFGETSEADSPSAQQNIPSSSALSTRSLPPTTVPALTTLCARIFVANLVNLSQDECTWKHTRRRLKALPDALVPKIFSMLRATCPTFLNSVFIIAVSVIYMREPCM